MKKIVVLGSMNMDLTILADPFPEKGETVTGSGYAEVPGGKGANQAVAVGRMGADINFISACGNDGFGDSLLEELKKSNVKTDNIIRMNTHTGIALIVREADGDNRIILAAGANAKILPSMVETLKSTIEEADFLLLQLEIPLETVEYAASIAKKSKTTVILDPAPAVKLSDELLSNVDYLLPNEHELDLVLGNITGTLAGKAEMLFKKGVGTLILTEGSKGVSIFSGSNKIKIDAPKTNAVDTTAAGDTFAGAFAYGLAMNWDIQMSAEFAVKAASLSVTKVGAQSSIPWLKEVEEISRKTR
ncbi:MAG: ribokinase [Spirochaetota bacterium]|nr:ribokinase [Spirochaetota bacterium]